MLRTRRHTTAPRARTRAAFTVIELLVVIAIIAILVGITFPALGMAREAGRKIQCMANLRGIGQGFALYMNDSDATLPYVLALQSEGGLEQDESLLDVLTSYMDVPRPRRKIEGDTTSPWVVADTFKCPSDLGRESSDGPVWEGVGTSYEYLAGELMLLAEFVTIDADDTARVVTQTYDQPEWAELPVLLDFEQWHGGPVGRNVLYFNDWRVNDASSLVDVLNDDELARDLICDIVDRFGGIPLPDCD